MQAPTVDRVLTNRSNIKRLMNSPQYSAMIAKARRDGEAESSVERHLLEAINRSAEFIAEFNEVVEEIKAEMGF